jgi:hypothetical protein
MQTNEEEILKLGYEKISQNVFKKKNNYAIKIEEDVYRCDPNSFYNNVGILTKTKGCYPCCFIKN